MNVKIEIDCTPKEARAFLGLPDLEPMNAHLVEAMTKQMDANIHMLQPEELLKSWTAFGLQAQDQFHKLMTAAAGGTTGR